MSELSWGNQEQYLVVLLANGEGNQKAARFGMLQPTVSLPMALCGDGESRIGRIARPSMV